MHERLKNLSESLREHNLFYSNYKNAKRFHKTRKRSEKNSQIIPSIFISFIALKAIFYQPMIIIIRFNPVMRRKLKCELAFHVSVLLSFFQR